MSGNVLLLFARRPALGQVKSRLAATMGEVAALAAYRRLLERASRLATDARWEAIWVLTGTGAWEHSGTVWEQRTGDLGERMKAATDRAFAAGAERVVVAGTDVPDLDAPRIHRMFDALQADTSWVTVPAEDGGYCAVGMRAKSGEQFTGRTWSHSRVHAEEIERAVRRGMRILALPCLADVDVEADWKRWHSRGGI
jgi:rSAM/selenodomain-associated transferase 1